MKKKTYKEKSSELASLIIAKLLKNSGLVSRYTHSIKVIEQSAKEYYAKAYDAGITHRGMKVASAAAILLACQKYGVKIEPDELIREEKHLKNSVVSAKLALEEVIFAPKSG